MALIIVMVVILIALYFYIRIVSKLHTFEDDSHSHNKPLYVFMLLFSAFLLLYQLGSHDFREDEFLILGAATGYLYSGQFNIWNWLSENMVRDYQRAWPHTWLVAQSYRLFGISEWSSRIISVLFGLSFYAFIYTFTSYFTSNRKISILVLIAAIFSSSYIFIFQYARMYALLLPLFLVLVYCVYRGITEECFIDTRFGKLNILVNEYLNFNYYYLLLSLFFLLLNYIIHVNSLVIIPSTFLFVAVLYVLEKKRKYVIFLLSSSVLIIIFVAYKRIISNLTTTVYMPRFLHFVGFGEGREYDFNYAYIESFFGYPFGTILGVVLTIFLIGLISYKYLYAKSEMSDLYKKYVYLTTITFFSLIFFVYFADRYKSYLYVAHITPIALLLGISGLWYILSFMERKHKYFICFLSLLILCGYHFYTSVNNIYGSDHEYGEFSDAYQVIVDHYNYENEEVIIGQYLRDYYLRKVENAEVKSMLSHQKYTLNQLINDLSKYNAGWITWETRKSYHIKPEIICFIDSNFKKFHGQEIDDTNVEVYYYDQNKLEKALNDN